MTPVELISALKVFIEEHTKDLILQVDGEADRPAQVFLMHLPGKEQDRRQMPYIILQLVNGWDEQKSGEDPESECRVRLVMAVYSEDESEGSMHLLNLMMRIRTALLRTGILDDRFLLKKPLEYIVYLDNTRPYYKGEMMTIWEMPSIEREVLIWP